jgi:ornithine cyclodeaminase/alanine dehydrogenase-like protein (mu-crystallin family)
VRFLDAAGVREALSMVGAIDALEAALRAGVPPPVPPRSALDASGGTMLVMPATSASGAAGVKLVTLQPSNPAEGLPLLHGAYVLFRAGTLEPAAVIDGAELTAVRTAAISGLATRYLARPEAATLVVFGAGVQARSHIEAMRAVRPVEHIVVVGRRPEAAADLVVGLRETGIEASVGDPGAVARADVVCCCTTSGEPLFDGTLLRPGTHVNAIGSYQPHTREIDTATVTCGKLVVDDREAVLEEAGDIQIPIAEGAFSADQIVADLRALVTGPPVRSSPGDVTVFKSVGAAWQDLILAESLGE